MINYTENLIYLQGQVEQIRAFEVWFRTPMGLYSDIKLAIKQCQDSDWDPNTMIVPIPVAVGGHQLHEELVRS